MNKITLSNGLCYDCVYESHWQEYGVWFADCNYPWPKTHDFPDSPDWVGKSKFICPNWKPKEISNCPIHGDFFATEVCNGCAYNFEEIEHIYGNFYRKGIEMTKVLEDIAKERQRQRDLAHAGDTEEFDKGNSKNDWIAYVNAYIGRAADKVFRNEKEGHKFRENMVKAAALCVAAIEAHDKEYC
jgi:hypothetical protein